MKKIAYIFSFSLAVVVLVSCSDSGSGDVGPDGILDLDKKVTVKGSASFNDVSSGNGRIESTVMISEFLVNVIELELEIDEDDERFGIDSVYSDAEFQGPFELDLLSDSIAVDLAGIDIPVGIYDEIEFKISPSTNAGSTLDGKSAYISGDIDGVPFIFWTDEEEEFEVNFPNNGGDMVVGNVGLVITINFDLNQLFGPDGSIDLSRAKDGDGNGIIEIYPDDPDGNNLLAVIILSELEESTEIEEDEDLDEDGTGNDEDDDIDGDGKDNDEDDDDDNDGEKDEDDDDDDGDGIRDEDEDDEDDDEEEDEEEDDEDREEEEEENNIITTLTTGSWEVEEYLENEEELTGLFENVTFTFTNDNSLSIGMNDQVFTGSWDIITNSDDPLLLMDIEGDSTLLILKDDWEIDAEDDELELEKETEDMEKELVLKKLENN